MKQIIILLSCMVLIGCQKKRCYQCITSPISVTGYVTPTTTSEQFTILCDITSKQARNYEKAHTDQDNTTNCTEK